MSKTYKPYAPRQSYLLPPSPLEWLPQGHLAYFILDVVGELDLQKILAHYERELRGLPPHHPQMMVALLLYAYCVGVFSSRKIERRTHEDVAFRVIAGGSHPDHTRISEFRRIHLDALRELFKQVLAMCQKAGLVKLGQVALDGTKIKANASKHKAMSYDRMKTQEKALSEKVDGLLRNAESADTDDDGRFGKGRRGDELPEELKRAETRLAKIREAKAALEAEARAQQEQDKAVGKAERPPDDPPADPPAPRPTPLPRHKLPVTKDGTPKPKAQRNFTDADSRIQKAKDGYIQGFNCQAAVDAKSQVVVAEAVTNQAPDVEHLAPMLEQVVANCGKAPKTILADAGYFSEANVARAAELGSEPFIAPLRQKHGERPVAVRGRPPAGLTSKQKMARKLATKRGAAIYARRKTIVEPVFGQIKQARGFRQFLLRGSEKVRGEWSLLCTTHNLLKLFAARGA